MFKRNQIQKTLLVSVLAVTASVCGAQETVNSQASITVQNAFNLNEVAPLNFGTVTVRPSLTATSTLRIQPDGVIPTPTVGAGGTLTVIVPGSPAQYTVDTAAPFTALTVTTPTTSVDLLNGQAPPDNGEFTLSDITFEEDGTSGAGAVSATIDTDVNGELTFNMGATLTVASAAADTTFVDGAYVGNYSIEVSY